MVAPGSDPFGSAGRNDSTVVTPWPSPFCVHTDIFTPGKVDTFVRELDNALRTRKLLEPILSAPLTLADVLTANPGATAEQCQQLYDNAILTTQEKLKDAAANLPLVVKTATLTHLEMKELNGLSEAGDSQGIYELIRGWTDVTRGRAQDRIRVKFNDVSLNPTDSLPHVSKQLDLKYYLYSQNTLFGQTTEQDQREAIRSMLR